MDTWLGPKRYYLTAYNGAYEVLDSAELLIVFVDPCLSTSFVDDHSISTMSTVPYGDAVTQTVYYDDYVSLSLASEGYGCSPYYYTLAHQDGSTDVSAFISIDSTTGVITLQTDDPSYASIAPYPIRVTVTFPPNSIY